MNEFKFTPELMLRCPAWSYKKHPQQGMDDALHHPFFRTAIRFSNPVFFSVLSKKNFDSAKLNPNETITLSNYLNRMCYRPTPFGLLASFSLVHWSEESGVLSFSEENAVIHILPDQELVLETDRTLREAGMLQGNYQQNPSCYIAGNDIRYLTSTKDQEQREYLLQSVPGNSINRSVLRYCKSLRTPEEIIDLIMHETSCSRDDAEDYLTFLSKAGMLVSDLYCNITGRPYFLRLAERIAACPHPDNFVADITNFLPEPENPGLLQPALWKANSFIQEMNGNEPTGNDPKLYLNFERTNVSGSVYSDIRDKLHEGLRCLDKLTITQSQPELEEFINAFKARYDLQVVPLLHVLDPQTGIGYQSKNISQPLSLLEDLTFEPDRALPKVSWTPVHSLLLSLWNSNSDTGEGPQTINLREEHLTGLNRDDAESPLPPSFAVMFRPVGDNILIESAGGASAVQIAGRFTPFNKKLFALTKEIVQTEQQLNPDVIFAEIVHLTNDHTDNINRREQIRPYEIPILAQSVAPPENQIALNDLWISVRNNRIVLQSKRLNRVVVPRLSSAYNYVLNDLPVFRFLCDLQSQCIKTNLSLDLPAMFPDMPFYPRVVYRSCILYPATWMIKTARLTSCITAPPEEQAVRFKKLAKELRLPPFFSLSKSDQQLVFSLSDDASIRMLLKMIGNKDKITLKESLLPDDDPFLVKDEKGDPYISQFAGFLVNQKPVYTGMKPSPISLLKKQRVFLPGQEWLYLKIYCHPSSADMLLSKILIPVAARSGNIISTWFFIRYYDPDYHIRFRVRILRDQAGAFLALISNRLENLVRNGIVFSYAADTYQRELERYGRLIEETETVFHASSDLVGRYLNAKEKMEGTSGQQAFIFTSLFSLTESLPLSNEEKISLFEQTSCNLFREFNGNKKLRVQLDLKYRSLRNEILSCVAAAHRKAPVSRLDKSQETFNRSVSSLLVLLPASGRMTFIADMIHMHMNRILTEQHRKQELVLYHCLFKYYKSRGKAKAT